VVCVVAKRHDKRGQTVNTVLSRSLPLIGFIVIGFLLKEIGLIHRSDRRSIARLMFATTVPAAVLVSLSRADVKLGSLLVLAACGALIPLATHLAAIQMTKRVRLSTSVGQGVVLCTLSSSVMTYLAPFFLAVYGTQAFNRAVAFDVGNALVASSYVYYVATRFAHESPPEWHTSAKRVLTVPHFWAVVLAFVVNVTRVSIPAVAMEIAEPIAAANVPVGMLLLGTFIELRLRAWKPMLLTLALRAGVGWVTAQVLVLLGELTGVERTIVSLAPIITPVGLVPLIYAAMFDLDTEFPAATLSLSILVAMVLTPILLSVYAPV
jgi:predicted permease